MGTISNSTAVLDSSGVAAANRIALAHRRDTGAIVGRGMTSDGAGDASYSSVELLMLMRGYNNSISFQDYALPQKTVQVAGATKLSTAQGRYENASAVLDGNNDYLRVQDSALVPGTGDFTIEQFIRRTGTTASSVNNDMLLWDMRATGILVYIGGQDVSFPIRFFAAGSDRAVGSTIAVNTWYHVALSRAAGVSRLFLDGVQQGADYTDANNYTTDTITIGGRYLAVSGDYRSFNGYLGALRFTKGVGRYSSGFTPPAAIFPATDNTLAAGFYTIDTGSYAGECTVVIQDNEYDSPTHNDLVHRTTPV